MIGTMSKIARVLHLRGIKCRVCLYLVNHVYVGTRKFEKKRKLLNSIDIRSEKTQKLWVLLRFTESLLSVKIVG